MSPKNLLLNRRRSLPLPFLVLSLRAILRASLVRPICIIIIMSRRFRQRSHHLKSSDVRIAIGLGSFGHGEGLYTVGWSSASDERGSTTSKLITTRSWASRIIPIAIFALFLVIMAVHSAYCTDAGHASLDHGLMAGILTVMLIASLIEAKR